MVAFATFTLLTHRTGAYLHVPILPFTDPLELANYALVGAACVPLSWTFAKVFHKMQDWSGSCTQTRHHGIAELLDEGGRISALVRLHEITAL